MINPLGLSPLAAASHDLIVRLSKALHPENVETGCRQLQTQNTNGLSTNDTRPVDVAAEIIRGVLSGVVVIRNPGIFAAVRGLCETGPAGESGDAERLGICERTCRDVRDSDHASRSDYSSALDGAARAARMTSDELRTHLVGIPPVTKKAP
ncbi:MAG: hypothetical protein EA376_14720 [Phycisphaeraceae bacterium]|nr:MAG: hypothetical protein EA376_14720 [Phycisphaeraceae bacterium]